MRLKHRLRPLTKSSCSHKEKCRLPLPHWHRPHAIPINTTCASTTILAAFARPRTQPHRHPDPLCRIPQYPLRLADQKREPRDTLESCWDTTNVTFPCHLKHCLLVLFGRPSPLRTWGGLGSLPAHTAAWETCFWYAPFSSMRFHPPPQPHGGDAAVAAVSCPNAFLPPLPRPTP